MKNYKGLLKKILAEGQSVPDRTGTGTTSLFGESLEFDLSEGFPLVTGKYTSINVIAEELRWFLSGSTNINDLDSSIWDEWADIRGDLGPIYGHQWRGLAVDQIQELVSGLKTSPHSRRHIVSAWNVEQVPAMALAPCHMLFQCYVREGHLDLMMVQRSADMFLGVGFNIASYALLTHLLCAETDLKPGHLRICFGDVHIYDNHLDAVATYLKRDLFTLPKLQIEIGALDGSPFYWNMTDYEHGPKIPAAVAV